MTAHVWDKLLHVVEYAGLAVLFCRALLGEGLRLGHDASLAAMLLASAYGATDEYHQLFVPLRTRRFPGLDGGRLGVGAWRLGAARLRSCSRAATLSRP